MGQITGTFKWDDIFIRTEKKVEADKIKNHTSNDYAFVGPLWVYIKGKHINSVWTMIYGQLKEEFHSKNIYGLMCRGPAVAAMPIAREDGDFLDFTDRTGIPSYLVKSKTCQSCSRRRNRP